MREPSCSEATYGDRKDQEKSWSRFSEIDLMWASICQLIAYVCLNKKKVSSLMNEVSTEVKGLEPLKSYMQKMLHRQNDRRKQHMDNLRVLYYRIEDILETYDVHEAEAEVRRGNRKWLEILSEVYQDIKPWIDVVVDAWAMSRMMKMLSDFKIDMIIFGLPGTISSATNEHDDGHPPAPANTSSHVLDSTIGWPKRRYSAVGVECFIGRTDDFTEVRKNILNSREDPRVICIWGEKGLGKSAMAWKLYSDSQVRKAFRGFAWVTLTNESRVETVLLDVFRQLGVVNVLLDRLMGVVNNTQPPDPTVPIKSPACQIKNCLIVVDRMKETDEWKKIIPTLKHADQLTKILITTCEEAVAKHRDVDFEYKLKPLEEDYGWELLKKYAFAKNVAPDIGMLPKVGREIVRKCKGLPLEISKVGRNLSDHASSSDKGHTLENWRRELDQYLSSDSGIPEPELPISLIKLNEKYQRLPYSSRQCFLYLGGISKQNESIDAQDLMFLWIGEGMVSSIDAAKQNFSRLADEEMLQVHLEEFSSSSRLNLCCLKPPAREFSLRRGVIDDFRLKVVDFCDGNLFDVHSSANLNDETRRLVIHFNEHVEWTKERVEVIENNLAAMSRIRSLLFLNSGNTCVNLPLTFNFAKLKLLRVVHFVRCKFQNKVLPEGIDKLLNLRYLGLVCYDLKELPPSSRYLLNLNVFNLRAYSAAQTEIQNVLSRMKNLRHLCLPNCPDTKTAEEIRFYMLRELETFVGFNGHIHRIDSLLELKKLRHLVAHAYSNDDLISVVKFIQGSDTVQLYTNLWIEKPCNFTSPEGLAVLEETLMCPKLHELTLSMVDIDMFPDCGEHFSKELNQIKLIGCKLKNDPMEVLGKFPKLRKLCLDYGAYVGKEMNVGENGFQSLEYLELQCLPKLEKWEVHEKAMPKLRGLIVRRCPKLVNAIPTGFTKSRVPTLKSIYLELSRDALSDVQRASYDKIFKHVPSGSRVFKVYDPPFLTRVIQQTTM